MGGMDRGRVAPGWERGPRATRPWRPLIPPAPSVSLRRGRRGQADPSAAEVAEIHRLRLANGLIAAVAEHGYAGLDMRELYERAKVSKRHFYEHYGSLCDCYMAVFTQITDALTDRLLNAWMGAGVDDPAGRLSSVVRVFVRSVAEEPAAARLALCEPCAVGASALQARQRFDVHLEELLLAGLQAYGLRPASIVVQAMFAGVSTVARAHLLSGREGELLAQADELGQWAWCCLAAPAPGSRGDARPFAFRPSVRLLAKAGVAEQPVRERILAATLEQAASHGCNGLSERAIRQRAKVTCAEFKQHFDCTDAAFAAVVARMWTEALTHAFTIAAQVREWPRAGLVAIETLLSCLVVDDLFARLAVAEMPTAGGMVGEEHRLRMSAAVARMLCKHVPRAARPSVTAAQASVAAIREIMQQHWDARERRRLLAVAPTLAFIALAPGAGAEAVLPVTVSAPSARRITLAPRAGSARGRDRTGASNIR
jgi:AcrR family transcriptional regulator